MRTRWIGYIVIASLLWAIAIMWIQSPVEPRNLNYTTAKFRLYALFESPYLYLVLNGLTLLFPLILSFDKKVAYFRSWKYLFPAIGLVMLVFIPWDIFFTAREVWGFNSDYYYAPGKLFGLPPGEWLFFITVPYACVFIYACLLAYFPKDQLLKMEPAITWMLVVTFLAIGVIYFGRMYTSTTCLGCAAFLIGHLLHGKASVRSRFYVAYLISNLPFLLVNGVLTGGFTQSPVVLYNNFENLGLRIVSIPVDDLAYSFLLLIMNVVLFDFFQTNWKAVSK